MDEVEEQQSQPLCEQINSCGDEFIEDLHLDDEIIEDQNDINLLGNDLKQSTANFSSYNGHLEPCLGLEFDEVEDARICYNAYARKKSFSIRKNHTRLSKGDDKLLIEVDYSCSREGFHHKSYKKKIHINSEPAETRV
jgi:hypothetical protein